MDATSVSSFEAEAQELLESWHKAVELFLQSYIGQALLEDFPQDMHGVVRDILASQIQAPDEVSKELEQAIWNLRQKKRELAKIQLSTFLFAHDEDAELERRWVALEGMARGNIPSIRRIAMGSLPRFKAVQMTPLPVPTAPTPIKEPVAGEALPTPIIGLGTPTIPVAYSDEALDQLSWQDSVPPSELFFNESEDVKLEEESLPETRRAIPPPCLEEEDAEIEVLKDHGEETATTEVDLIFEELLDKS